MLYQRLIAHTDPEVAHAATVGALRAAERSHTTGLLARVYGYDHPRLAVEALGLHFASPLGLAAGLDKNACAAHALAALGFSFVEVGTVTPRPQSGNERPRLWRRAADGVLVNSLGFPSRGAAAMANNLSTRRHRFVLGINIGKNATTTVDNAPEDYGACAAVLANRADYLVINISSPNTPGLRAFQSNPLLISAVVRSVVSASKRAESQIPVLLKVSPDLTSRQMWELYYAAITEGVSGIIATNTLLPDASFFRNGERGGVSGKPLRSPATAAITELYHLSEGKIPIIGVGGIFTWRDAIEKIKAGATLLQIYSGFVLQGPSTPKRIKRGIVRWMEEHQVKELNEVVGTGSDS